VNWFIPADTACGPATVTTTAADGTVTQDTFSVEAVAPGIFTVNGDGSGPPAATIQIYGQDSSLISRTPVFTWSLQRLKFVPAPIDLGSPDQQAYLILYGTGSIHNGGQCQPPGQTSTVEVRIGNTTLPAVLASQIQFLGLDQVNVLLPRSLAGSGLQDVTLIVNGVSTPPVQLQF
jgi:uncharacterized protein (TIGR03437 family)